MKHFQSLLISQFLKFVKFSIQNKYLTFYMISITLQMILNEVNLSFMDSICVPYFYLRGSERILLIFKNNQFKNIYRMIWYRSVKKVIFPLWSYMTLFTGLFGVVEKGGDDRQIIKIPRGVAPAGYFSELMNLPAVICGVCPLLLEDGRWF